MVGLAVWIVAFVIVAAAAVVVIMLIIGVLSTKTGRDILKVCGLVVMLVVAYLIYANNHQPKEQVSQPSTDTRGYPLAYSTNFRSACIKNSGTYTSCSCAINLLQVNYTYPQALQFESDRKLPDALLTQISQTCK